MSAMRSGYKEIEIFGISRIQGWNIKVLLQHTEDKGLVLRKKKKSSKYIPQKANNPIINTGVKHRHEIQRKEINKYLRDAQSQ